MRHARPVERVSVLQRLRVARERVFGRLRGGLLRDVPVVVCVRNLHIRTVGGGVLAADLVGEEVSEVRLRLLRWLVV